MRFVKLSVGYYRDNALAPLSDAHEVMFTRGLGLCGEQPGGQGFIPDALLPSLARKPTPARCRKLANDLVSAGLWLRESGGYRVRSWLTWQDQLDALEERRRKDRQRQAARRARSRDVTGQSRDASREVTGGEVEEEKEKEDAAASVGRRTTPDSVVMPPPLLDLKARLDDVRLVVRWDRLDLQQVLRIDALLAIHGPARLVKSAQAQWRRDDPPAFAQAWLPGWEALPRVVGHVRVMCEEHELEEPCRSCAADRKAGA